MELAGGSKAGCALPPFGERKKTQLYLHICKACKLIDFRFPF